MPRSPVIRTAVAATALAAATVISTAQPSFAGNLHAITTAPSPSTGAPVTGGGSWIVNKPSGYYVGRARPGDRFDNELTSSTDWHYGRAPDGVDMCGWVMPGSLGTDLGDVADTCSATTRATIAHRLTVGRDFNATAHDATDGSPVPANTACTVYLNYFHGTDYTSNGGHWADPVGSAASSVQYRFTTRDGAAAVVRDPVRGWGFLPVGCVTRPAVLHNDND